MTTYDHVPTPSTRRWVLTSLMVAVALVCGPLAFAPAQAATATVSGRVLDSAGAPVEDAWIGVYERDDEDETYYREYSLDSFTDELGRYSLDLAPGTYKLQMYGDRQHVSEYYEDAPTLRAATPVVVGADPVALDDAELELLPTVRGTVTADGGAPLGWGYVVAFQHDAEFGWDEIDDASTDRFGHYVLPLEPGTYRLGFFDGEDDLVPEYWEDAPSLEQGQDVTVGVEGVTGIDAQLTPRPVVPWGKAVNAIRPQVQGFVAVKQILASNDGMWKTDPVTIQGAVVTSRQWLRNGVPIPGATGQQHQVTQADLGSTLSVRVTGSGHRLEPQTVDSAPSGVVKWNSKVTASSKPGRKKATLTIAPTSYGGKPTGTVTIKLRNKAVRTVRLRNGKARVTLKLKRKQKYDLFYNGSATIHASRAPLFVKIK